MSAIPPAEPGVPAETDLRPRSRQVTEGPEATASRGGPRAAGGGDEGCANPQRGIAAAWTELTPGGLPPARPGRGAEGGVHAAGGCPLPFGTLPVSEGIPRGHEGMHFSLVSRDVIA